jgi:hypothetical protein
MPCFLMVGRTPLAEPLCLQSFASLADVPAAIEYGADAARFNPLQSRSLSPDKTGAIPALSN